MAVRLSCDTCNASYNVPDHQAQKKLRCRKCGGFVQARPPGWGVAPPEEPYLANPIELTEAQMLPDDGQDRLTSDDLVAPRLSGGASKPASAGRFKTGQCCDAAYTSYR